jgi:hypothetical protein
LRLSFFINKSIKNQKEKMSRLTGTDAYGLMEAYNNVYAPQELTEEQVWEEVENWVNSLVEEGYDLSDYTWEEMYESYLEEQGGGRSPRASAGVSQNPIAQAIRGDGPARPLSASDRSRINARPSSSVTATAKPAPTTSSKPQFGTTTPKGSSVTSTGVSGLSAANRAAYSAGGGNAAAQRGMGQTTAQVIAQGKNNLGRMDQGRTAPASARPTSGPSVVNPKSGVAGFPAARPAAGAPARPAAAPAARPAAGAPARPAAAPAATPKPAAPAGGSALDRATAAASKPTAFSPKPQSDVGKMIASSQARQAAQTPKPATPAPAARPMGGARGRMLGASFDPFDVIKGHLLDEGYADTEEAALVIMANMSEEWKQSIITT